MYKHIYIYIYIHIYNIYNYIYIHTIYIYTCRFRCVFVGRVPSHGGLDVDFFLDRSHDVLDS